jgi:hypothetical protein
VCNHGRGSLLARCSGCWCHGGRVRQELPTRFVIPAGGAPGRLALVAPSASGACELRTAGRCAVHNRGAQMRLAQPTDKTAVARVIDARCGWMGPQGCRPGAARETTWCPSATTRPGTCGSLLDEAAGVRPDSGVRAGTRGAAHPRPPLHADARGRAVRPVALARSGVQGKNARAAWSSVITSTGFGHGSSR